MDSNSCGLLASRLQDKMIVDIAFALDCTGSMQGWIDAAKHQVREIVRDLSTLNAGSTFRMGAVLYRDFGDEHSDFNQFRVIPFTESMDEFQHSMEDVQARGGDDEAEDVAGAFHHVNALDWRGDVKTLFHLTDAPAHGLRYHEVFLGDRFPEVDPANNNLENEVLALAHRGVTLVIVKANDSVNKMITEFSNIYSSVPNVSFRVQNLVGQTTTPPRMRRDVTFTEPPPILRHRMRGMDTPELRTLSHMVTAAVSDSMATWSAHSAADPTEY